tara:strand:+ start:1006 stop:2649 length:1644 start_codon:yes stop_codon:yes gene_type:complete
MSETPTSDTVVYRARKIVTMDPNRPEATHVAVREGRILAVGGPDCAAPWGGGRLDERFGDAVLLPGFVEGHGHMMTGAMWRYVYAGDQDRVDPDGNLHKGMPSAEAVVARLKGAAADIPQGEPIVAWGFDPIFLGGERLNRRHLDEVSTDRPVAVVHSNFHLLTVNSKALEMAGYSRDTNVEGVARFANGEPNGELQEMAAMFPILRRCRIDFRELSRREPAVRAYAKSAMRCGVTTATDLAAMLEDEDVDGLLRITASDDFSLRIVPTLVFRDMAPADFVARAQALGKRSSEMLRLGSVKIVTDGSIQGFTARLKWPGHLGGQPNGIWNVPPAQLFEVIEALNAARVQMHIHTNGDEASEVTLDALEAALCKAPWPDHRHTLQHVQMAGEDQFARMAAMGVCANLFANHMWYFGDAHYEMSIGPDRARRMDACRSALDHGVTLAIHSDTPVTPMGPLTVAWCAVNRITPKGRVLGEAQRITVAEALHAITLGPAKTLKMDAEIGSIETGKKADFAVLADDPLSVAPYELRNIEVLGTVSGGRVFMA